MGRSGGSLLAFPPTHLPFQLLCSLSVWMLLLPVNCEPPFHPHSLRARIWPLFMPLYAGIRADGPYRYLRGCVCFTALLGVLWFFCSLFLACMLARNNSVFVSVARAWLLGGGVGGWGRSDRGAVPLLVRARKRARGDFVSFCWGRSRAPPQCFPASVSFFLSFSYLSSLHFFMFCFVCALVRALPPPPPPPNPTLGTCIHAHLHCLD